MNTVGHLSRKTGEPLVFKYDPASLAVNELCKIIGLTQGIAFLSYDNKNLSLSKCRLSYMS